MTYYHVFYVGALGTWTFYKTHNSLDAAQSMADFLLGITGVKATRIVPTTSAQRPFPSLNG